MSRRTRMNYEVFEDNMENVSDLVKMFTTKNKRVNQIFDDGIDDDPVVADKSYGIRLVSLKNTTSSQPENAIGKENLNEPLRRSASCSNVKILSPVPVVPAPTEKISVFKSPQKRTSLKRQNLSLRRSLFQQQAVAENPEIVCSTPFSGTNRIDNFFGSTSQRIDSFSPIKKGLSDTVLSVQDFNGIELMEQPAKNPAPVNTLKNLEKDLRQQFQINEKTPQKSYSKSVIAEKSIQMSPAKATSPSRHSEPIDNIPSARNCSVRIEAMEISRETASMYRKAQMTRLSSNNLTNINTFNMIETPVVARQQTKKSVVNDSLLAKKLALCESDSEMTDDDSIKAAEVAKKSVQPATSRNSQQSSKSRNSQQPGRSRNSQQPGTSRNSQQPGTSRNSQQPEKSKKSEVSVNSKNSKKIEKSQKHLEESKNSQQQQQELAEKEIITSDGEDNEEKDSNVEESDAESSNHQSSAIERSDDISSKDSTEQQSRETTPMSENITKESQSQTTQESSTQITQESSTQITQESSTQITQESSMQTTRDSNFQNERESQSQQSQESEESRSTLDQQSAIESINCFRKPRIQKIITNLSNVSDSVVPVEVVQSFRALPQKAGNDTNASIATVNHTLKVGKPCGRRPINKNKERIEKYIQLKKVVKNTKTKGKETENKKKRTLYTQSTSMSENESNQNNDIDPELRDTLENIRQSLDDQAEVVSQPFDEITTYSDGSSKGDEETNNNSDDEETRHSSDEDNLKSHETTKRSTYCDSKDERSARNTRNSKNRRTTVTSESENEYQSACSETSNVPQNTNEEMDVQQSIEDNQEQETRPRQRDRPKKRNEPPAKTNATRKRANNSSTTAHEPPKKASRVAVRPSECDSDGEQQNLDADESGFQSEENDFIRYDPYERGCQRPGLRVRKYMRPYWLPNNNDCYVEFGTFTKQDLKAYELQQKHKIKTSALTKGTEHLLAAPSTYILKIQEMAKTNKFTEKKSTNIEQKTKRNGRMQKNQNDQMEIDVNDDNVSVASYATTRTNINHAVELNNIFKQFNQINQTEAANEAATVNIKSATYDICQINRLEWVPMDTGISFCGFNANSDGFIKIEGGIMKKKSKVKESLVKFALLCGTIKIRIDNDEIQLSNLGFVMIKQGQLYSIRNPDKEDAIIVISRINETDLQG